MIIPPLSLVILYFLFLDLLERGERISLVLFLTISLKFKDLAYQEDHFPEIRPTTTARTRATSTPDTWAQNECQTPETTRKFCGMPRGANF